MKAQSLIKNFRATKENIENAMNLQYPIFHLEIFFEYSLDI